MTQGLILAAGKGERIRPISNFIPKPLLKIGKKTLIEHQINLLEKLAIREIIVVTGHLGTLIENFLNRLSTKTKIITIRQPELNGEIGAVDCARGHLSEEFLVLHGDNYLAELDYFISHKKIRTKEAKVLVGMDKNKTKDGVFYLTCSGTLSVVGNENTVPVTPLGCYLLNPSVFEEIDELKRSDVRTYSNYHLFRKLLEKGHRVYGVRKRGIVVNINTVQDLVYLRRELCNSGKSEISAHN